ncbi:MAG: helix-turn-helix transcriptional regulator [Acidobacteria bacterium]|nr:helix-turn-helix transcriptional regulator [Acidobacteriota bacterium]
MPLVRTQKYREMLARLRAARKEAGLKQAEVGRKLGKPQSYVSKVETGERRIDPVELLQFAELYGREVTWFLDAGARGMEGS